MSDVDPRLVRGIQKNGILAAEIRGQDVGRTIEVRNEIEVRKEDRTTERG